jgi:mono/diheme cytochrome c family protein
MMRKVLWLAGIVLSTSVYVAASGSQGVWLLKVPEKDRLRVNPLAQDNSAVEAGALVFMQHCASCHGSEAEGIEHHPSLRTIRVHEASDGELQWLLRNGSLAHGMPAWSGLPEVQRWQVVRYLHSLPLDDREK